MSRLIGTVVTFSIGDTAIGRSRIGILLTGSKIAWYGS